VEALQNGSVFFKILFKEHECAHLTIFGWKCQNGCGWKRSKTADSQHHFVGPGFVAIPFCRLEKRSQSHFVDKKIRSLQYCPPREWQPGSKNKA
jgi:hypothetical protein